MKHLWHSTEALEGYLLKAYSLSVNLNNEHEYFVLLNKQIKKNNFANQSICCNEQPVTIITLNTHRNLNFVVQINSEKFLGFDFLYKKGLLEEVT